MSVRKRKMNYIAEGGEEYVQRYREHINLLVSRSHQLSKIDRVVIRLYFVDSYSVDQIAVVAGISPEQMSRRFKRLLKRIKSYEFIGYLRVHIKLKGIKRRIGRDYFIRGISMQRISIDTGCSLYRVRQIIAGIKKMVQQRLSIKVARASSP